MSSTGRGQDRIEDDVYPTPAWTVSRLLEGFPELPGGLWIEPCVGSGAIVRAVLGIRDDVVFAGYDVRDTAKEALLAGCKTFERQDFVVTLQQAQGARYRPRSGEPPPASVVITNPPYSRALEVVKYGVMTGAWTVMLLRLNFLGSGTKDGRSEWLRANPPDVGVLPNRPSFAASIRCKTCGWRTMQALELVRPKRCPKCGMADITVSTTDSIEYAWFVWPPADSIGEKRRHGNIKVLGSTPETERKAGH